MREMSDNPDPGGGGDKVTQLSHQSSALPVTSVWAGDKEKAKRESVKMRSFEEIIADATANRNIMEIHLKKNLDEENPNVKPANLTFDQIGELLFDHLKIKSEDCLRFNFSSYRYDRREVILKPNVDITPYLKTISDFYGHTVTTVRQSSNIIRVSFRNVPLNVPDEEIVHLCSFYGTPLNNKVEYEKLSNVKCAGLTGSTRFVDMEMNPGSSMMNFYWMEGPLPGDQGCRITVLHSGQDRQCSHCLKTLSGGCPGQGQGKVCKSLGTKMTRMIDYMAEIKINRGYESLKTAYLMKFPAINSKKAAVTMEEELEVDSDEKENPVNSKIIDQKNIAISELEKDLEERQKLFDQKLFSTKRSSDLAKNKISTATTGLDMFLVENMKKPDFDEFNSSFNFLISQYSALLYTPECYTVEEESGEVVLADKLFENILSSNPDLAKPLDSFKKHLKTKLAFDLSVRRERRNSAGQARPRLMSNKSKRAEDDINGSRSKIARAARTASVST